MSASSRHSSITSTKLGLRSRQSSMIDTCRSSRAGSRQASPSGGVVGLPGASLFGNDPLDPSLLDTDHGGFNFDIGLDPAAYDSTRGNAAQEPSDIYDANQFQEKDFPSTDVDLGLPNGFDLGLNLQPVYDEQQFQANQTAALSNGQYGLSQDQYVQALWAQQHASYAPTNIENFPMAVQTFDTTSGLPTIPAARLIAPQPPFTHQQPMMCPDPQNLNPDTQPYFDGGYADGTYYHGGYFNGQSYEQDFQPPVQQYEGYVPKDDGLGLGLPAGYPMEHGTIASRASSRQPFHENNQVATQPKTRRPRSEPDGMPTIKRRRQTQVIERTPEIDHSRHNSTASDGSSFEDPVEVFDPVRAGEKPKKVDGKGHVRTNTSTRGETTRTAGINQYTEKGSKYKHKPLPLTEKRPHSDWATRRFKFEYTHHQRWGMDELKKSKMSADEIYDYITQFPNDLLRIWIQRTPADSSRRYPTGPYDDCRFEECPNRVWANKGTIEVGHYRVAFDEKHKKYGKDHFDPFDCAGYAHLYCMERFLDFPFICQVADVRVDTRVDMPNELKGVGKFAFSGKQEAEKLIAERFVKAAKADGLHRTPEFHDYPAHGDYKKGRPKPHFRTLTYALYKQNTAHRSPSQRRQFIVREIEPGFMGVHMGDQEVKVYRKRIEAKPDYKKWRKGSRSEKFPYADYYDDQTKMRIAECLQEKARLKAEEAADIASEGSKQGAKKRKPATAKALQEPSKKRKRVAAEDSDDEPDFEGYDDDDDFDELGAQEQHAKLDEPTRQSQRKKKRVDYTEPQDDPLSRQIHDRLTEHMHGTQYLPQEQHTAYPPYGAATLQPAGLGLSVSRKPSGGASHLFPTAQPYDIDQLPAVIEDPQEERRLSWNVMAAVDELIDQHPANALNRRKSSTMSTGPFASILKSPQLHGSPRTTRSSVRTASFNAQPVSSSKEYRIDDPPSQVATSPDLARAVYDHQLQGRRSVRLASKATSPPSSPDKVESGRISKRRK